MYLGCNGFNSVADKKIWVHTVSKALEVIMPFSNFIYNKNLCDIYYKIKCKKIYKKLLLIMGAWEKPVMSG